MNTFKIVITAVLTTLAALAFIGVGIWSTVPVAAEAGALAYH